ncbi:hypothetical protein JCM3775_003123 [Rhodotorula graminis]
MAKGSNPVDAHRKAQRKQELKKNKQKRETTREISTVKTDTRPIEAEIRRLTQESQKAPLSKTDKDELSRLRADLARLNKAKQEYVDKHPEHRKYVFPERAADPNDATHPSDEPAGLYDRQGRLKHPERSLYFDPVFNPYGAPPPGMPYREKPEYAAMRFAGPPMPVGPSRAEIEAFVPVADASSDDDDDDIAMPAGPPPTGTPRADDGGADSDSDDSDDSMDIPLPPGPPPPRPGSEPAKTTSRPTISRPTASSFFPPPHHTPHALPSRPAFAAAAAPQHPHHLPPPPPPPPGHPRGAPTHAQARLPARPPPAAAHMSDPLGAPGAGPQRAFQQGRAPSSIGPVQPDPSSSSSSSNTSSAPAPAAPSPFLALPGASSSASASGATISAAPVLRDLKKEATAFVPAAMRRKMAQHKATLARAGLTSVDAARGAGEGAREREGGEGEGAGEKKKSLVEEMRDRGIGVGAPGAAAGGQEAVKGKTDRGKEDYERFRAEMGDLL